MSNGMLSSGPIKRNITTAESYLASFIIQVYSWMAFGLLLTAGASIFISSRIASNPNLAETLSSFIFPIFLVELVLVLIISSAAGRASVGVSGGLFVIYSLANGVFFGILLTLFGYDVAGLAFLATFLTFAVMAIYGAVTHQDLTRWGNLAFMGLIAGIIGSIVNIFAGSEVLYWIITYGLLAVFVVLIAYDSQKLKSIAATAESKNISASKYAVSGALTLYLDFINLFILILRIFGGGRD